MTPNAIIKILITIKSVMLLLGIISVCVIAYDQFKLSSSPFPEHVDFLKEKEGVAIKLFFLLIPIALSVIVDLRELKIRRLDNQGYLLTNAILVGYVVIKMFGQVYVDLLVAAAMCVVLILVIRWQGIGRDS